MRISEIVSPRAVFRATLPRLKWPMVLRRTMFEGAALLGLVLFVVLGTVWSYRQPLRYSLPVDQLDGLYKDGLGEAEESASGWQRWAGPYALVRFPGIGRASYQLNLGFHNPEFDTPRTLTVVAGTEELGSYQLRPDWQRVIVTIPPTSINEASGDLDLLLRVEPPFAADDRQLGVAVQSLGLAQISAGQAPPNVQWMLVLSTLLLVGLVRVLGVPMRWTVSTVGLLLLLLVVLLAFERVEVLITLPVIGAALKLSLLALPLLWLWVRTQPASIRPWARGVALVVLGCFVVRLVGMQHPQFVQIDHTLRVHQIQALAAGQRADVQAKLSLQYEWGSDVAVPYSLLSYDLFVPLACWLSRDQLLLTVEAVTAALDASIPLLLWSIGRRSGWDAASSWWSAALFGVLPVGYLYFHDGSYPTIIGLWVTVVSLWLLTLLAERPRWWLWIASGGALALSILMYVTHLAFVPMLLGVAVMSAWVLGKDRVQRDAHRVAIAIAVGFIVALLGYYGAQLPELITRTIPSYLSTIREGGSVGRDANLLPGPLLGSPWQQLWGHYSGIAVLLAAVGILLALRQRGRWTTHVLLAYGIFLFLTAIVDLRFGLWNKHMYFALPGVCLAAGLVLGQLQRRGVAGQALVWGVWSYLLWTGIHAWLLRVVWYVWSLETI